LSPLGWALPKKHKEHKINFNGLKEKSFYFINISSASGTSKFLVFNKKSCGASPYNASPKIPYSPLLD
jgi:hypothetical protein